MDPSFASAKLSNQSPCYSEPTLHHPFKACWNADDRQQNYNGLVDESELSYNGIVEYHPFKACWNVDDHQLNYNEIV